MSLRDLLCMVGAHQWTAVRRYLRGISLYEEETCRHCGRESTVVSGVADIRRLDHHLSKR